MAGKDKVQSYKVEAVNKIKDKLEKYPNFLIADYRGLSVAQTTTLRTALRESGSELAVVRNTFARIALKDVEGSEGIEDLFKGPTALVYSGVEASVAAKSVVAFSKDNAIELRGGFVDGVIMSTSEIDAFSKLPTKSELIAKVMGSVQAPAQNFVFVLNGVATKLVRTLVAVRDNK